MPGTSVAVDWLQEESGVGSLTTTMDMGRKATAMDHLHP